MATHPTAAEHEIFGMLFDEEELVEYRKTVLDMVLVFLLVFVVLSTGYDAYSLLVSRAPLTAMSAQPPITRPTTPACVETVVQNQTFSSNSNQPYVGNYTSPTHCPAPWAMIVLDWNGRSPLNQLDRVGALWLGRTEIFRTINPETSGVSWHVEKDVSEYSSTFAQERNVTALVLVPQGMIVVTASLTFYESSSLVSPLDHSDVIIPLANVATIPWARIDAGQSKQFDVALPRNVVRASMEVYATAHNCDETWYSNNLVPNAGCQGSNFREAFREIRIAVDGRLIGVVWPFPYIYTGGLNPDFWESIPAVNVLNIPPYHMDLTPFIGPLDDGLPHQISFQIVNNHGYWLIDGNLMIYLDGKGQIVSGNLTQADIPSNAIEQVESFGLAYTHVDRTNSVTGYVDTSGGRIVTSIRQTMQYVNYFLPNLLVPSIELRASTLLVTSETVSTPDGTVARTTLDSYSVTIREGLFRGNSVLLTTVTVDQAFRHIDLSGSGSSIAFAKSVSDAVHAETFGTTSENYVVTDSSGFCYHRYLSASRGSIIQEQKLGC